MINIRWRGICGTPWAGLVACLVFAVIAVALSFCLSADVQRCLTLSFDVKANRAVDLQVFFSDDPDNPHKALVNHRIHDGDSNVMIRLPVERLCRLRIDFGSYPGGLTVGRVSVCGEKKTTLDWNDFEPSAEIDKFSVDDDGVAHIVSNRGDPFAVYALDLDLKRGATKNLFDVMSLALLFWLVLWMIWGCRGRCGRQWLVLAVVVFARLCLTNRLPPIVLGDALHDDAWCIARAENLLAGEWLGPYDQMTLLKGFFAPFAMACSSFWGISFMLLHTLLYVASIYFFVSALFSGRRRSWLFFCIFALLIFAPISFDMSTFQRAYRNGMALWQVPLIFGALLRFLRSTKRERGGNVFAWGCVAGVGLFAFFNTREDGVWIWPCVLAFVGVAVAFRVRMNLSWRRRCLHVALCLTPVIVATLGNLSVCAVNWVAYGVPLRNDRSGNFAKAMRDLFLIEGNPVQEAQFANDKRRCPILASTVEKACDASPTLGKIRMSVRSSMDYWGRVSGWQAGQPLYDHVLFAIRDAVAHEGYYSSLKESEAFYGLVHRELTEAFASGRLKRRGTSISPLVAPLRSDQMAEIWHETGKAFRSVVCFQNIAVLNPNPTGTEDQIRRMEHVTGDVALPPNKRDMCEPFVRRACNVAALYRHVVPVAFFCALLAYLIATFVSLRRLRVSDAWLAATCSLASLVLVSAMVGYVSATTFPAVISSYLVSAYLLVLFFCAAVTVAVVSILGDVKSRKAAPRPQGDEYI